MDMKQSKVSVLTHFLDLIFHSRFRSFSRCISIVLNCIASKWNYENSNDFLKFYFGWFILIFTENFSCNEIGDFYCDNNIAEDYLK